MTVPFLIGEAMTGGYGATDILHDCTVAVEKGKIAVIVGPNGAGKSTAMKAVFGMLTLRKGRVVLDGARHHRAFPAGPGGGGHGLRAADQQRLHLAERRGEPRDGRLPAPRRHPPDHGAGLSPVPDPEGQAAAGGGGAFGRPAPAGGGGPRADDPAEAADAGRAHRRRLAHRDGRTFRPHHRGRAHRHLDPDGRTERAAGAGDRRRGYVLVQGANAYTDTGAALLADPEVRPAASWG